MSQPIIRPVILCGGSGTRLWPLSREAFPKQFAPIIGKRSTFQETLLRVKDPAVFGKPLVITNRSHRFMVERQLAEIGIAADILLEPMARDSGPAVLAAALYLHRQTPDALALMLAADHLVLKPKAFVEAVVAGRAVAAAGGIVTFGILPTSPATGYGYIDPGEESGAGLRAVRRFVEKPDARRALEYVASGYLWNSGNFLFAPSTVIGEYRDSQPECVNHVEAALAEASVDLEVPTLNEEHFAKARKIAFDIAVMEKTRHAHVVAGDFGWSDIGDWNALWEVSEKDNAGNAGQGPVLMVETEGSYVSTEDQLVATLGVKDLVVVATRDAVLVADRHKVGQVKQLVERLKQDGRPEASHHARVFRPWGWYQTLVLQDRSQVKRIVVYPGGKLSLQKHFHRSEHWVVVRGTARVTIGDKTEDLIENQSAYIPSGVVHRLENPGRIDVEIIEVQTGSYLGEDDIVRLQDIYSRAGTA
ncbi:MAG: mannose-1-phosphate guanylyltransferase/mannose-6-phosphate isomerase [Methylobacterium sp.]|nr:mannose-1-phosphate guanylyltransferase/mannose-6-phosphate isomerase [Methylobacterium sp.]MCA3655763.1 mannose-1-phosphate guanylyltransferase/mannose-6-phosphate isomerase [Methylobacterium sp.]MCA3657367.1 mannose-1-phosphate guanylyltransferase/mannose-6-phosphate isomerase [Methylobacterium sp.]MCA3664714.1 mannose-1-phosphate guanylyltransferase/mannose-6-phosphate isomerase [Methylobacterium sp.]MCA3669617.1 mannose-1-phosphate guanylyltransferase/mannose-6-phosphate isomerase [Methy